MTGVNLLEKLLDSYQSSYDIDRAYDVDGDIYDAHASFNVTSAKYVLIKKAELWRANCFEHVFFRVLDYRFAIRGYSEARLLVFDLENHKVFGNRAAKDLVKGYTKARII